MFQILFSPSVLKLNLGVDVILYGFLGEVEKCAVFLAGSIFYRLSLPSLSLDRLNLSPDNICLGDTEKGGSSCERR